MSQPSQLPVAVLLDANFWYNDPLLKGPQGAALLHHLTSQGNFLALPEVVQRENEKNLQKRAKEHEGRIGEGWRFLERITGERPEYRVPSEEELLLKMTQRLEELKACIVKVPLCEEHLRKALDRVIEGSPPNGPKNEQYKDSLIWEALLELAVNYRVKLVTTDGHFFKDKGKDLLADNLDTEAKGTRGGVDVYKTIFDCLESLRPGTPELVTDLVVQNLDQDVRQLIEPAVHSRGFRLGQLAEREIKAFVTERLDRVSLRFTLTYDLMEEEQTPETPREEANARPSGACFLTKATEAISEIALDDISLSWSDAQGKRHELKDVFLRTSVGGRSVPYNLRSPL